MTDGQKRPPEVDIAFTRSKVAVQVHGTFWHCRDGQIPKHNSEYWTRKFEYNRARDAAVAKRLTDAGWTLVVVWEDWTLDKQLRAVETALHGYYGGHFRA